jgi:hypothetical protein
VHIFLELQHIRQPMLAEFPWICMVAFIYHFSTRIQLLIMGLGYQ